MRNLKKFENFDGFAADEEADQMNNDQIYADRDAQDAQGAQAFGGQESQEEEGLELDEVVDRVLAVIDECGEDCRFGVMSKDAWGVLRHMISVGC